MKILVFADSHTDTQTMLSVAQAEQPDCIFHLGDHIADALVLQKNTDIEMHLIKGNTDQASDFREEELLTLENRRIFMIHGHQHDVENGLSELCDAAKQYQANIVLFGHTHKPYLGYTDGIWLMNPGRIGRKSSKTIHATYCVIQMMENQIRCEISEVNLP